MRTVEFIARNGAEGRVVQTLPDGSIAIFEVATQNVYSLNRSAAAAWEACASPTTLPEIAAAMSRQLRTPITEDVAHEAVCELAGVGLVTAPSGERAGTSRRELLKHAAEVAIPLVLVLTGVEQRAHAQGAGSSPGTTVPGTTTPGTTAGTTPGTTAPGTTGAPLLPVTFIIWKFTALTPSQTFDRQPLVGAEFDILNDTTGQVVAHLVTGADGRGATQLIPGVRYRIVETFAPPSLDTYTPFVPLPFTMPDKNGFGFDLNNVFKSS